MKPLPLPKHVPGVVITVSLDRLPEYLAVNGLEPSGQHDAEGVLLVQKTAPIHPKSADMKHEQSQTADKTIISHANMPMFAE